MYSITTTLDPRYPCSCTALRYALFFWLLAPAAAWSDVDTREAEELIYSSRDTWFGYLKNNILTQYPQPGSEAANLDRLGSIDYTQATPDRLKLANADASQVAAYKLAIMTKAALGALTSSNSPSAAPDLEKIASYKKLRSLYNSSTYAIDADTYKNRRADFILKDNFLRGRPKDVLDSASEYKKNYIMVTGSSFPSGHTWDGYEAANNLSLIFPERGSELISRALQYGESRIVLKMHFPTDTIASRAGNYYYLSTFLENDTLAKTFFELSKDIRAQVDASKLCPESLRNCLDAQASPLTDAQANENYSLGYYKQMLARPAVVLTPTQIPQQAGNLLRFRFPYLKSAEWRQILASTAYPSNSLAGWTFDAANPDANWGLINLPRAFAGPTYFYEDFTVTQNPETDLDLAGFSRIDTWKEAIAGPGALIKDGSGTLVLAGNNTFRGGTTVSAGTLVGSANSFGTGSISNNASLVLDQKNDASLTNNINGSGSLTKNGDGKLTLADSNGYSGGTLLNAGTLIGSASSFGTGNITNNANLELDQKTDASLTNNISGSGSLTKNGDGKLILADTNGYSGGTLVNAGTLMGSASSFGTGNITNNASLELDQKTDASLTNNINGSGSLTKNGDGKLTLADTNGYSGGTLLNAGTLIGSASSFGTGNITNNASLELDQKTDASLANTINGSGSLTKNGDGKLILADTNGYSGGTLLNAGTLIGSASSFGTGNITNNASLELDQKTDASLINSINGGGSLTKSGDGKLTLADSNGYSGGTLLNAGTLIGSASSFGTGNITNNASLELDQKTDASLANTINGSGTLAKTGTGNLTLDGRNAFQGGTVLNAGTLTLGNNLALSTGGLTVGGAATLDSSGPVILANDVILNTGLTVGGSNDLALGGAVSGTGPLIKNGAANLTLSAENTFKGGITLNAGVLTLGSASSLGTGDLTVAGAGTLDNSEVLSLVNSIALDSELTLASSNNLNLAGTISGASTLIKNGLADLNLSGNNTFTGPINVRAGSLSTLGAGALGNASGANIEKHASLNLGSSANLNTLTGAGNVRIGAGSTLSIGGTHLDSTFGGSLLSTGSLDKLGTGTFSLTGDNGLTGDMRINAGTLNVSGSLQSANTQVGAGATLTGTGSLSGVVNIAESGHLALSSGNTLSVGSLVMAPDASLDVGLGSPATGGTPLLAVLGNLSLGGKLNVSNLGGFGSGIYRLISYNGALQDHGMVLGLIPGPGTPSILNIQTAIDKQINLLVSGGNNVQFWDGGQAVANGALEGGSGTWGTGESNWTNVAGSRNSSSKINGFSVFQGTAGNVVVKGAQAVTGLQFVTDGYNLISHGTGGELTLIDGNDGTTTVRVDPNATATLGVAINGSATLAKLDSGTLVLNGGNGYTGGTTLKGGTLIVGHNSALGTGVLTTTTGTTLDNNTAVALENGVNINGLLNVGGSNTLALKGVVTGGGGLTKNGVGSLILNGLNTYQGSTVLNSGGLILGSNSALGRGMLNAAAGTTLDTHTAVTVDNTINLLGNLSILGSSNLALSGWVSGTGSLTKTGIGVLTLADTNSYSGGTTVSAGTLIGTASSFGAGAITNNASLVLDQTTNANLVNRINGTGSLSKTGTGVLTLADTNSYSGGTTVSAGTLIGTASSFGTGAITNNANLVLDQTTNANLVNTINGTGSLSKTGIGALTLADTNAYSGGTTVSAGTLAGSASSFGTGTITNNASLMLDQTTNANLANRINGTGNLSKTGTGALTLADTNSYSGGTTVSAGTLVGTASSFGTGAITNNASLVVNQASDASLTNTIGGTGTLTKTGSGALILNANASLDGGTQVRAGSLIVGGAAGSSAVLRGNLQVNGAALLGGHGQVIGNVTLANGATLSPGNSIGTLHVNGDVQFGNGSNLNIEANPDGHADRLQANGIVSLAGANLKVLAGNGDWSPSTRYQIVQAGSVTGRFSTLSSNLAFLSPLLTYSSQGIDLELQRNDIPFTSVSQSSNQSAVANALEPAATQELSKQVTNLSADQARAAFDSLSGELHASTRGVLFDDSRQVRESLGNRLRGTQGQSTKEGILHHDAGTGLSVWLGGYGSNSEKNGNHAIASVSHRNKGSLLGIDVPMGEYWRAGLVAGYGSSNLNLSGRDSSASIDSTTLGAYLGGQWDAWNLRLGLTHSWNKIDSKRGVNVGPLSERLKAGYDADTTQVFGELGYALQYGDLNLEPFVGLTHVAVASATLREHGGNSALTSDSERASINYAGLGVNINAPLAKVAGMPLNVRGSLAWQHALDLPDGSQRVSLSGYDSFAIKGAPVARDTVLAQLGVSLQLAPHVNLDLGYSGQAGSGTREHGAQLGLNVSF